MERQHVDDTGRSGRVSTPADAANRGDSRLVAARQMVIRPRRIAIFFSSSVPALALAAATRLEGGTSGVSKVMIVPPSGSVSGHARPAAVRSGERNTLCGLWIRSGG